MQSTTNFRPVFLKKVVSHFSRNLWPWICKKSQKISNFWKKNFSLETTLNALKFVRNTICAVHNKFQAGISQKRSWSFFKKSVTPDMQKKVKKFQIFEKKIFRSKRAKTPYNSFATPFVQSTTNFRSVSLKKEVGHFSRNLWPGYAKKVKKLATFEKFFFARNDLKRLKILSQHHLCSPRNFQARISK